MLDIRDRILATPRDIEDLAQLGKELKICPYYGSRRAIKQAEVSYPFIASGTWTNIASSLLYYLTTFYCKCSPEKL